TAAARRGAQVPVVRHDPVPDEAPEQRGGDHDSRRELPERGIRAAPEHAGVAEDSGEEPNLDRDDRERPGEWRPEWRPRQEERPGEIREEPGSRSGEWPGE